MGTSGSTFNKASAAEMGRPSLPEKNDPDPVGMGNRVDGKQNCLEENDHFEIVGKSTHAPWVEDAAC